MRSIMVDGTYRVAFCTWQHLAADSLGSLPSGDYAFVVVDYYSRFFEMEPVNHALMATGKW